MFSYRALTVLSLAAASFGAHAQRSATVLPANIYRVRAVGVTANPVLKTLNADGERQNLMGALERTLTAKDIAASDPALQGLYDGLNQFEAGLGDSLITADLLPQAEINARQMIFALEYGLTDRISLGIIVPTVQMKVNASFNARVNSQAAQVAERTQGVPALEQGVAQFQANAPTAQTFADGLFTSAGYKTPSNFEYSGLSDIELGAKVQYLKADRFRGTCLAGVRAPTATYKDDPSNLLDSGTGDGQWDLAAECANEFDPLKTITLGVAARYTVQLPNTYSQAVLRDGSTDPLPKLNDPSLVQPIDRDLGDMVEAEVSTRVNIGAAWHVSGLMEVAFKAEDRYTGSKSFQISELGSETETMAYRAELGVGYSTIPEFSAKRFPVPMEVKLAYNTITQGYNVPMSAYARMDLVVYF